MKITFITTFISLISSVSIALVYKHINDDRVDFVFYSVIIGYSALQFLAGILFFAASHTETPKRIGQGLMLGAGIAALIGFSICTANFMKS